MYGLNNRLRAGNDRQDYWYMNTLLGTTVWVQHYYRQLLIRNTVFLLVILLMSIILVNQHINTTQHDSKGMFVLFDGSVVFFSRGSGISVY